PDRPLPHLADHPLPGGLHRAPLTRSSDRWPRHTGTARPGDPLQAELRPERAAGVAATGWDGGGDCGDLRLRLHPVHAARGQGVTSLGVGAVRRLHASTATPMSTLPMDTHALRLNPRKRKVVSVRISSRRNLIVP